MEYIRSKDIFMLTRDTLYLLAPEIVEHGYRVAYMVYKMLSLTQEYQEYEMADIIFLVTLHDIGACHTDKGNDIFQYETKHCMPHSIYGYLFYKNLSPQEELARVILYHHSEDSNLTELGSRERQLTGILKIADRADIYSQALGDRFDSSKFRKLSGGSLSREGLELFYRAIEEFDILHQIKGTAYREELDIFLEEYMIFSHEEKKRYLEMLMYCLGFRSYNYVVNAVTCICICEALGEKMGLLPNEKEILYYGALLHDLGMLYIPVEIVEAPRQLAAEERRIVMSHVELAAELMQDRVKKEVLDVILAHHERGDGSGYPNRLNDAGMNKLQRILQAADMVTALINDRKYRTKKTKQEVIAILNEEAARGKLNRQVVNTLIMFYDEIYDKARKEEADVLSTYNRLLASYNKVYKRFFGKEPL